MAALIFAACEPQYVLPTTEREGFTSISAYFTSGEYNNLELARLEVTGDMLREGRLVIKVPYYYPESSDKATTKYLGNLRMKAELDKNCRIYPPLTILDLNLENEFTYTDAKGNAYPIVITGKGSNRTRQVSSPSHLWDCLMGLSTMMSVLSISTPKMTFLPARRRLRSRHTQKS